MRVAVAMHSHVTRHLGEQVDGDVDPLPEERAGRYVDILRTN